MTSIGWDIGGVHLKAARIAADGRVATRMVPLPLAHEASALAPAIRRLALEIGPAPVHGVTMTGELSQRFRTKADGVDFILGALEEALPEATLQVLGTDGQFMDPASARRSPLLAAASNWVATAMMLAQDWPDVIMIDMGSTTTDILPISGGSVVALGRTDPDRLASGELVYTGLLRTRAEALVRGVPWKRGRITVAPDDFALVADAHLWQGTITAEDCTQPMADGGPATREAAGDRLARLVCADHTMATEEDIGLIADAKLIPDPGSVIQRFGSEFDKLLYLSLMSDWDARLDASGADALLPKSTRRATEFIAGQADPLVGEAWCSSLTRRRHRRN